MLAEVRLGFCALSKHSVARRTICDRGQLELRAVAACLSRRCTFAFWRPRARSIRAPTLNARGECIQPAREILNALLGYMLCGDDFELPHTRAVGSICANLKLQSAGVTGLICKCGWSLLGRFAPSSIAHNEKKGKLAHLIRPLYLSLRF